MPEVYFSRTVWSALRSLVTQGPKLSYGMKSKCSVRPFFVGIFLFYNILFAAFTRTLTTLYSTTLLTLLTTVQLTILAHTQYVHSVLQQERSERSRERLAAELTMSNILLGGGRALEDLMAGTEMEREGEEGGVSEEVESKYLTLSWWLLHVGWKDVGERVRRGVEEVFDG